MLREEAIARSDDPDARLNPAVARFVTSLECLARAAGQDPEAALVVAADLLRPTFCAGWFLRRAFEKPRGYPGDYLLLQRIYEGSVSGDGLGALLDRSFLDSATARAARARPRAIANLLKSQALDRGATVRVCSLGCGPAQELEDAFEGRGDGIAAVVATLVDIDPGALRAARRRLRHVPGIDLTLVRENLHRFVATTDRRFDVVLCVGVFDYLSDSRVVDAINGIHALLAPDGIFLFGNCDDRLPPEDRFCMEHVVRWHLAYRDRERLHALAAETPFRDVATTSVDPAGIQLLATLRR
ncbi:MAG: extracellular factor 3-hydroxypalmitic acid methyl ester biosynthesis protein [Candidatus Binatota bacterium]|nr:extracellular factor 3-hydroxypalmitic acid methyl ester biosynthesis protein [Candidatus Binatota bacterium]